MWQNLNKEGVYGCSLCNSFNFSVGLELLKIKSWRSNKFPYSQELWTFKHLVEDSLVFQLWVQHCNGTNILSLCLHTHTHIYTQPALTVSLVLAYFLLAHRWGSLISSSNVAPPQGSPRQDIRHGGGQRSVSSALFAYLILPTYSALLPLLSPHPNAPLGSQFKARFLQGPSHSPWWPIPFLSFDLPEGCMCVCLASSFIFRRREVIYSLKRGHDLWKAQHSHAVPGSQVPVYESLGTQVLHATGNVCHELHQHLSGQELGGQGRRE